MLRRAIFALALLLPQTVLAQDAPDGFRSFGLSVENGGHPAGDYTQGSVFANGAYAFGWGELGVDLTLTTSIADTVDLTTAEALFHFTARPASWIALGPYFWYGSQSRGGTTFALGVEAAVSADNGWGGEIYFGETRGGVLEDGYATNKGLRLRYDTGSGTSGYAGLAKDTINLDAGDQDFYRLALGLERRFGLGATDRDAILAISVGQHHFDKFDERENWLSVGMSFPLQQTATSKPEFSTRRGLTHRLPIP